MSEQDRANMLIKAICEIEAACDGTNDTHRDIWQIAHDAIMNNAKAIDQANGVTTGDSGLHLQRVSVAKHPLPRPLECWNKARKLDCGDYIEWHLKKERGNAR